MKRHSFRPGLLAAIFLMFFALPAMALADDERTYGVGLARVTYISGDTLFNSPDTEDWAALSPNFTLREGDRLWAGDDGKMEVGFSGGNYAWLNYDSELDMTRLEQGDRGNTYQVGLPSGEASFMARRLGPSNSVFQVDTPNASVRAYGKARFRVSALSDGTSQVGVSEGSVEVESDQGITDLKPGEMAEVSPDGEVNIASLPETDDWDRWVDSRSHRYARPGRSARYLPADMEQYSYEFDEGGQWVSYPEYGRVWVPAVAPGWSPYSNGRWCWVANDYVWLPYDPWYAPFHYGRWSWSVSLGWFWAPPLTPVAYWSPGYVSWVWGPDYVGWVPLAPREIYYGYGYYGPHSVNIYKTKVVKVTNVYINSRVNNGVVVVNRNNFVKGDIKRVVIRNRRQNPFLDPKGMRANVIAAPPIKEIKPTRDLILPRPHIRPAAKALPPARVEKLAPIVIKRPVARAPQASVLRPGAKPRKLDREVLRQRRPEGRPVPFRRMETGPRTPAAPAVKEREMKGRQAPQERRVQPARPERPAPGARERALTPPPRERAIPREGRGRNLETPGRARPAPQRERIERAPRERVRPVPPVREEGAPERRGIERAPEAVPETRPGPQRERGSIEPPARPGREARPALPRERITPPEHAEQLTPPPAARGRERSLERPAAVEKEGKIKEGRKKNKEPREKLKEDQSE